MTDSIPAKVRELIKLVEAVGGSAGFIRLAFKLHDGGPIGLRDSHVRNLPLTEAAVTSSLKDLETDFIEYFNRDGFRQARSVQKLASAMVQSYLNLYFLAKDKKDGMLGEVFTEEEASITNYGTHLSYQKAIRTWLEDMDSYFNTGAIAKINKALFPNKEPQHEEHAVPAKEKTNKESFLSRFEEEILKDEKYKGYFTLRETPPGTYDFTGQLAILAECLKPLTKSTGIKGESHNWKQIVGIFYYNDEVVTARQLTNGLHRAK